jgi:hypothetical protein
MQTQQMLNKVCNTVCDLRNNAIAAQQLVAQAQHYKKLSAQQLHNLQVLTDMLQNAYTALDDAACTASTASDMYAD